mgnify:CR=1 FL=1
MGESAISAAASGTVAYMGAQRQAAQMKQQATAAELRAEANSQIAFNNAVAQSQDAAYQQSVSQFNKADNNAQMQRMLQDRDEVRRLTAQKEAAGAKAGVFNYSFSDTLKSDLMLEESKTLDALSQFKQRSYEFKSQAYLQGIQKDRALEEGAYQSSLTLSEGAYQASSLRGQAQATKIGGIASALGSFSQAGAYGSQIKKP